MIFLTIIPGVFFVILFITLRIKLGGIVALLLKICASLFFIFTALIASYENDLFSYGIFIIIALIFGLIGDILLDLKWIYPKDKSSYLLSGFISFMIGHIIFLIALLSCYDFSLKSLPIPILISVMVSILILVIEKPMGLNYGSFKVICVLYGFLLTFVTVLSGFLTITINPAFFLGLVLFLLSDMILSVSYFGKDKNTAPMIASNHLLYYGAQYLIAYSIIFYKG